MERVSVHLDFDNPSPAALRECFCEIMRNLDAMPRAILATVRTANALKADVSLEMDGGEPVFRVEGRNASKANFGGRWLAEHPSPLRFSPRGTRLVMLPTTGNRVKVRLSRLSAFLSRIL